MKSVWMLVVMLSAVVVSADPDFSCSYMNILKHLSMKSSSYELSSIRPVFDWHHATNVSVDMFIEGILGVNEMTQTVTSKVRIQVTWWNEILRWNASDFCGIDTLTIPRAMLWNPDIYILEDSSDGGTLVNGPLATVDNHGMASNFITGKLMTVCKLKLDLFPFDTQKCNFTFQSFSMDEDILRLDLKNGPEIREQLNSDLLITKGEWNLIQMNVSILSSGNGTKSKLSYMITLKRKPMLYIINFIVPLGYLLALDVASFFISESSGEKMSFKVTVLLSISVLLLILQDMLPSTEDNLPLIASFCISIFALVGISLLECMLICCLINRDKLVSSKCPKSDDVGKDVQGDPDVVLEKVDLKKRKKNVPSEQDLLAMILQEVKTAQQEVDKAEKPGFYEKLARILDGIFFVLYLSTVFCLFVYLFQTWVPRDFYDD